MIEDPSAELQGELAPGETLLWAGQPRQGVLLRPGDAPSIPFGLAWTAFFVFWEYKVLTLPSPLIMKFWGIPFIVLGLYVFAARFVLDARRRTNTHYALTSDRILIINRSAKVPVISLDLHTLSGISPTDLPNGYGTITFGSHYAPQITTGKSRPRVINSHPPCFDTIEDARAVYELIRSTQKKPRV